MQWLVTGCSSGLGLALVEAILAHPDQKVIATSRNPPSSSTLSSSSSSSTTNETIQRIASNPHVSWEALDVGSASLEAQLAAITSRHGSIDVLINNAGYALGGAFESLPLDTIRRQYETNLMGPIRTMQALLPGMRERQTGVVVNISSAEAWDPHAGASVYASSKWALEGLSQALAAEVAPFGVRVLLVQPGGMRTGFLDPKRAAGAGAGGNMMPLPEAYKGTMADFVLQAIVGSHGVQKLDPMRSAEAIVREVLEPTVVGEGKVLRLPLGAECVACMEGQRERVEKDFEVLKTVALACDFEE